MPLIAHARTLRRGQTDAKHALWTTCGNLLLGHTLHRQHSYGRYLLDFVCLEARLVLERDGDRHQDSGV